MSPQADALPDLLTALDEDRLPRPGISVVATPIPGCFELRPSVARDPRGSFAKIFHRPLWRAHGLETEFAEEYVTFSRSGTVRGLHFQLPPMDHAKVVVCLAGRVADFALDLRRGLPTYGRHYAATLSAEASNALYLPRGVAHGFATFDEPATLYYKVTSVYSPGHDAGIRWNSAGIDWPVADPILSERDHALPRLEDFDSPFRYDRHE